MAVCATYLDCNATASVRDEVVREVTSTLEEVGNPSSVHQSGRQAQARVEAARAQVAALVGAPEESVVFTSGGTEANNMALSSVQKGAGAARILYSATEHASVRQAARHSAPQSREIPVDTDGVLDLEALKDLLEETAAAGSDKADDNGPVMVSVMLANNETGVLHPVAQAGELAHAYGAILHCDAVQAAGKIPVQMNELGADLLTLSAHKMGGPQGVGALIVAPGCAISPLLLGGGQEKGRRAGTQNTPGIAGFGVAARLAVSGMDEMERLGALRDRLERDVREIDPDTVVFGSTARRLANTSCFTMAGVSGETQVMALDLAGVAVGSGSACSSGRIEPSEVLKAMGAADEAAQNAIRVSLGWQTSETDIERFLAAWSDLRQRIGAKAPTVEKARTAGQAAA